MKALVVINAILTPVVAVLLLLAVMARIESPAEHLGVSVIDVFLGAMVAFSFALAREVNSARRPVTVAVALFVWVAVSGSLLLWHGLQVHACALAPQVGTRNRIAETYDALTAFSRDCGSFPAEDQGLHALSVNPGLAGWKGPYLADLALSNDVWGHPLHYALRGGKPLVWSSGPDGISGTADDVVVPYEETSARGG